MLLLWLLPLLRLWLRLWVDRFSLNLPHREELQERRLRPYLHCHCHWLLL